MMAANLGKPSTRSLIRASYRIELTTPTLRPKLRSVPRMSDSMSISLRWTSLRLVSSIRCSWATNVFTCTQADAHHLRYSPCIVAIRLIDLLGLEQCFHVPRFHTHDRQVRLGQAVHQPLR